MLNPRRRGANPDLARPPPEDLLDLGRCCLPDLKTDDGVPGRGADEVGGDEADLRPGGFREVIHPPYAPDGGFDEGLGVSSHTLVPDGPLGDSGELARPSGSEGELSSISEGDHMALDEVDERFPRVPSCGSAGCCPWSVSGRDSQVSSGPVPGLEGDGPVPRTLVRLHQVHGRLHRHVEVVAFQPDPLLLPCPLDDHPVHLWLRDGVAVLVVPGDHPDDVVGAEGWDDWGVGLAWDGGLWGDGDDGVVGLGSGGVGSGGLWGGVGGRRLAWGPWHRSCSRCGAGG